MKPHFVEQGVLKLGFSWMGHHVILFRNREQLKSALKTLLMEPGLIPTSCFIQDLVPNVVAELRIHAFPISDGNAYHYEIAYALPKRKYFTHNNSDDEVLFNMASGNYVNSSQARSSVWWENELAQEHAEKQARELVDLWLLWYKTEWSCRRCPANARFDFHVSWDEETLPQIWTCEVTECGASLCDLNVITRHRALINSFFTDTRCEGTEVECICRNMLQIPHPRHPENMLEEPEA